MSWSEQQRSLEVVGLSDRWRHGRCARRRLT